MKKIILFASATMLATATLVYAAVDKKPALKETKKEVVKKEIKTKKRSCNRASYHCVL